MKIAVVHPKFDLSGGAERYALTLAECLSARGHEVHLFGRRCAALPGGARFHRVGSVPLGRALKTYSFWKRAGRAVARHRFDVVQGFGKTTCQTVHRTGGGVHRAYLARTGAGVRTAYDRVAVGIEDRLFDSERLRAVVCPSRWVADEVARYYPAVEDRCRVIPNGVDLVGFAPEGRDEDRARLLPPLGIPGDVPVVLFVATNFRLKGLDRAVTVVARRPGLRLVVAGPDDPAPFAALAGDLGCADRVHFLGAIADPAPWYRTVDVLVHPTRYDPFANVCLEALACGTPVVTGRSNGAADVLGATAARVVGREDEPDAWRAALDQLLGEGGSIRSRARALACRHGIGVHVGRVADLYLRIAGRSTHR